MKELKIVKQQVTVSIFWSCRIHSMGLFRTVSYRRTWLDRSRNSV